ncbi:N-acetylmuramoyl-L-alanine amidase [Clostridium botulinum]|uniref:peptidoglycan recognition protein family protein n=1 Tax=Clostridium botulinum TaxID=1491 RepID=UPI001967C046|nr:peptidoglycan recognition family protein [Clostridium botulinum]MBN1076092.1 N-acetylmuramoyl-L-alanine amidase [Clostridium botulinum]
MNIVRQISKFNNSEGNDIKYIVIHSTGNTGDTAKNNADYFGRGDRQSSAHYFIDDNSIYQVVEEYKASWHCGDGGNRYEIGNHNSIGIEMCGTDNGNISDATINNTIELVKILQDRYNINNDNVVRHYDASRKCCPSQFSYNNWARWNDFKDRLNSKNKGYVVTNYFKNGYRENEEFEGIDLEYVLSYFKGIRCYMRHDSKGQWIETQTLPYSKCLEFKETLGSWFYKIK